VYLWFPHALGFEELRNGELEPRPIELEDVMIVLMILHFKGLRIASSNWMIAVNGWNFETAWNEVRLTSTGD